MAAAAGFTAHTYLLSCPLQSNLDPSGLSFVLDRFAQLCSILPTSHLLASSVSGTALSLQGRLAASRRYFATGYAVVPPQYQRTLRPRSPAEAPPSSRPT